MKYEEIFRLKHLMENAHIPFDFKENHFDGYHLMYPHKGECVCSVVEFDGSYGAKQDLLEIQGLMTKKRRKGKRRYSLRLSIRRQCFPQD